MAVFCATIIVWWRLVSGTVLVWLFLQLQVLVFSRYEILFHNWRWNAGVHFVNTHQSVQSRDLACTETTPLVVYCLQWSHVCWRGETESSLFYCETWNDFTFLTPGYAISLCSAVLINFIIGRLRIWFECDCANLQTLKFFFFKKKQVIGSIFKHLAQFLHLRLKLFFFHPYWLFLCAMAKSVWVHERSFLSAVSFVCLCRLLTKSILCEQQGDPSLRWHTCD